MLKCVGSKASTGPACLVLILLSVTGAFLVLYATVNGPWMGSDSVEYVVSADNLRTGKGLGLERPSGEMAPMSHFPPGYSIVIAVVGLLTGNGIDAARVAGVILILMFGLLLGFCTLSAMHSPPLAFIMTMIPLTSSVFLNLFTGALSEPMFLVFLFAGAYGLARWLAMRTSRAYLLSALALGLAAITRYAGVAFVVAGAMAILAFAGSSWGRRLRDAALYLLLSGLPFASWLVRLALQPSTARAREIAFPDLSTIWATSQSMRGEVVDSLWRSVPFGEWLPELHYIERSGLLALCGALTVLVPVLWWTRYRRGKARADVGTPWPQSVAVVSWTFVICYLGGLALASLLVRPAPDIDMRMMAPAAILLWWLFGSGVALLRSNGITSRQLGNASLVIAGVYLATLAPGGGRMLRDLHENGWGYTSDSWRSSPTISVLREMPADVAIVTNESAAVMLLAGRPAYDLPEIIRNERVDVSRPFGENQANPAEQLFREGKAVLVLFRSLYWQLEPLYGSGTNERIRVMTDGLTVGMETADATMYRWSGP
jgi:hypothetical protein